MAAVYVYWLIAGALKHPGRTDIAYTAPTSSGWGASWGTAWGG